MALRHHGSKYKIMLINRAAAYTFVSGGLLNLPTTSILYRNLRVSAILTADNNSKNVVDEQSESLSRFQRLKSMLYKFGLGCKALLLDVKQAVHTRRRLGLYNYNNKLPASVSRDDLLHMRQTQKDIKKSFPVAMLFMVPFLGYFAPVIAYFYPKQLLSQQFWHPDQKRAFVLEEYEQRSQYYQPLIKELGVTSKEIGDQTLLKLCLEVLDGHHPTNEKLLEHRDTFNSHDDLSLLKMPRYHLVKLCRCWLVPTGWYLPRWYLTSSLRKRVAHLHEDDLLLQRDGIDNLTSAQVEHAVHVRGADEQALSDEAKLRWIREWVGFSTEFGKIQLRRRSLKVNPSDYDGVSLLAHCAIFKSANFPKTSATIIEESKS